MSDEGGATASELVEDADGLLFFDGSLFLNGTLAGGASLLSLDLQTPLNPFPTLIRPIHTH